jgi:hypothetical protein
MFGFNKLDGLTTNIALCSPGDLIERFSFFVISTSQTSRLGRSYMFLHPIGMSGR